MKNRAQFIRALATAAATASILSFGLTASAQDAAKKAPAAKAATVSACKGLAEAACKANTAECAWIAPKAGKQKPYCRSKPAKK